MQLFQNLPFENLHVYDESLRHLQQSLTGKVLQEGLETCKHKYQAFSGFAPKPEDVSIVYWIFMALWYEEFRCSSLLGSRLFDFEEAENQDEFFVDSVEVYLNLLHPAELPVESANLPIALKCAAQTIKRLADRSRLIQNMPAVKGAPRLKGLIEWANQLGTVAAQRPLDLAQALTTVQDYVEDVEAGVMESVVSGRSVPFQASTIRMMQALTSLQIILRAIHEKNYEDVPVLFYLFLKESTALECFRQISAMRRFTVNFCKEREVTIPRCKTVGEWRRLWRATW